MFTGRRRLATVIATAGLVFSGAPRVLPGDVAAQASRPNIILMFPDNLGWGEGR